MINVLTGERMRGGRHFDCSDEVVHSDLHLVLHVFDTTLQWVQVQQGIPGHVCKSVHVAMKVLYTKNIVETPQDDVHYNSSRKMSCLRWDLNLQCILDRCSTNSAKTV